MQHSKWSEDEEDEEEEEQDPSPQSQPQPQPQSQAAAATSNNKKARPQSAVRRSAKPTGALSVDSLPTTATPSLPAAGGGVASAELKTEQCVPLYTAMQATLLALTNLMYVLCCAAAAVAATVVVVVVVVLLRWKQQPTLK